MIVFRVGWMQSYNSLDGDEIVGGGEFIAEHGFGGEIFNFRPFEGYMYGCVQPPGRGDYNARKIHIEKLGARKNDPSADGLLVAWAARNPYLGGTYVVGWYKDATVFREWHEPPRGSNRTYNNEPMGYYAKAKHKNCVLLPVEKRSFQIPRGKGSIGMANIWYPDAEFEQRFMQFIQNYEPNGLLKKCFSRLCERSEAISHLIKSIISRLPRRGKRSSQ